MTATAEKLPFTSDELDSAALAAFCKAAGDELRLNILRLLRNNDYGVLELCQLLSVKQSGMSHHLKVLANAGLVVTRRDGNSIYYRRAPEPLDPKLKLLHQTLYATVDQLPVQAALEKRIGQINEERSRASREFFQQNADKFQTNQDLIASYTQYGESITEFLDSAALQHETVLEVGPGEGDFLADLSPRFDRVIALDNSAEMLARSEKLASQKKLVNVQFIHGDTRQLIRQKLAADCITLNMVLHHTPEPAQIFSDLAKVLRSGGSLLVTELCQHDQNWARESCGDLWLGFDPNDLTAWANAAGLEKGESLFLTQRNGFQIQLRQFTAPKVNAPQNN